MAKNKGKKGGKVKVGIKGPNAEHVKSKKPTGKPPKQIRMTMSLANQHGAFLTNHLYLVPQEVPVDTARRWIESGAAVEDKSIPAAPEKK